MNRKPAEPQVPPGCELARREPAKPALTTGRWWSYALPLALLVLAVTGGCATIRRFAVNKIGDTLASGGSTYESDDDPELVGDALPFGLKLMESLLAESPKHASLLLAASRGFTGYAYAYVQQDADAFEDSDPEKAAALRTRARNLYLRARNYGLRGLETRHPGLEERLRQDPRPAVRDATAKDVPLLYWTAVSWGAAIAVSKDKPALVAEQLIVEALIDRALELDPNYDFGAIDGFLISYEASRQGAHEEFTERSREHFKRAVALTHGQLAYPFVALAETVDVKKQDRAEFESLLRRALEVDPDARPEWRLNNLIAQRRARWLLSRIDDLFLEQNGGK